MQFCPTLEKTLVFFGIFMKFRPYNGDSWTSGSCGLVDVVHVISLD